MKKLLLLILMIILCIAAYPQASSPVATDTLRKDALNVYMDATDYIKKEIPYVNYIRDIKDAGVYIISTNQRTGSGGIEYTYFFVGQNENAGMRDTLSYTASPDDTQEIVRTNQVRILKMGLMRYVAKTPLSKYMSIGFTMPLSETVMGDKWNSWIFRTSFNGYVQGEQTTDHLTSQAIFLHHGLQKTGSSICEHDTLTLRICLKLTGRRSTAETIPRISIRCL
jgi:hypothetical protein